MKSLWVNYHFGKDFFFRNELFCVWDTLPGRPKDGNRRPKDGKSRPIRTRPKGTHFRGLDPSDWTRPTGPVRPDPSGRIRPTGPVRPITEIGYIYLLVEVSYGYGFINLELALKELVFDGYCCYIFGANLRILFIKQISSKSRGCDVGCCYGICNLFG